MMKIGEFAKENKTTVRTLHHYEALGLLLPAQADPLTGYRYYEAVQAKRLRVIHILKELGFSLSEIGPLLEKDVDRKELRAQLNGKYVQARVDRENALNRSLGIEGLLRAVDEMPGGEKINLLEVSDMSIVTIESRIPFEESLLDGFRQILERAGEKGKNISLMVMDIDMFDRINKDFGHRVGDAVLDAVRRAIKEESPADRDSGGMFWGNLSVMEHRGGDEYLNWIECSPERGRAVAESIRANVESIDFSYLGMDRNVTVSIGLVHSRDHRVSYGDFIGQGDSALYRAKLDGRNCVREGE